MRNYPSAEKLDIFVLLVWVHTIKIILKQLRHIFLPFPVRFVAYAKRPWAIHLQHKSIIDVRATTLR